MKCRVILFKLSNNETIKTIIVDKDTYLDCEAEVLKLNEKLTDKQKDIKHWKLTEINV